MWGLFLQIDADYLACEVGRVAGLWVDKWFLDQQTEVDVRFVGGLIAPLGGGGVFGGFVLDVHFSARCDGRFSIDCSALVGGVVDAPGSRACWSMVVSFLCRSGFSVVLIRFILWGGEVWRFFLAVLHPEAFVVILLLGV